MPSDLLAWLSLLSVPGLGPSAYATMLARFGSPERILSASVMSLCRLAGIRAEVARAVHREHNTAWARDQLTRASDSGVQIITLQDPNYPRVLKEVYAPPPVLFTKGEIEALSAPGVAIVGSRAFTPYGRTTAHRLAGELARRGFAVTSGMATGIDTHAHLGALEQSGLTIAVLGSGLDRVYPVQNASLFESIPSSGAVLSEFPMGTGPEPHNFPRRNRVISGLSLGVVVVEAGERSGALITARHALEQNRDVFAVPGPIHSGRSTGTHALLKEGAILVQSVHDILAELPSTARPILRPSPDSVQMTLDVESGLDEAQRSVYRVLPEQEPIHIDTLSTRAGLSVPETLAILLGLELRGLAEQLSGKRFLRQVA